MRLKFGDLVTIIGLGGVWIYRGRSAKSYGGIWVDLAPAPTMTGGMASLARLNCGTLSISRNDVQAAPTRQKESLL